MAYEEILYDVSENVATVTLNRPAKLNAWTPVMQKEVEHAMTAADADDQVRVIILTGAGRSFCAGADMATLGQLASADSSEKVIERIKNDWLMSSPKKEARPDFQKTYSYFPALGKPVLAALNGPTVGLGLILSLYCDIRFASESAKFSTAFARRGLVAEYGIAWMLPRLVGVANTCDLLFSARMIDATEALHMGLVNRVVPQENFLQGVRQYAREMATQVSPLSLRIMKKQIYDSLFQSLGDAIDVAVAEMFKGFAAADFKEGIAHYLEKRPPAFTGK